MDNPDLTRSAPLLQAGQTHLNQIQNMIKQRYSWGKSAEILLYIVRNKRE